MLVTRRLEIEALILVLLNVSHAGVQIMRSNGKSRPMIVFRCENCGQSFRVKDRHAGRKGRCPKCKNIIIVPTGAVIPAESKGAGSSTPSSNEAADVLSAARGSQKGTPNQPTETWLPEIKFEVVTDGQSISGMPAGAVIMKPRLSFRNELIGTIVFAAFTVVWIFCFGLDIIQTFLDWKIGEVNLSIDYIQHTIMGLVTALILIGGLFYCFLSLFNPRPTLILSSGSVPLGGVMQLRWEFTGRIHMIRQLTIMLYGREYASYEVMETVRRNDRMRTEKVRRTKDNTFLEMEVVSTQDRRQIGFGEVGLVMPTDSMHSFEADWNKIVWVIEVHGYIRWWPDVEETFKIAVLPAEMEKA